jgi:hypothetical protein
MLARLFSPPMETNDWKVLTCPKCSCLVQTARNLDAAEVICPSCQHSFAVAESVHEAAEPSQTKFPKTRNIDPNPYLARPTTKGALDPKHPELRQIDFKEKLGKTTDHAKNADAEQSPKRLKMYRTNIQNLLAWDETRVVNASPWQRLKQFLSQIPKALWIVVLGLIGSIAYAVHQMPKAPDAPNNEAPPPATRIELTAEEKFGLTNRATILADIAPVLVKFLNSKNPEEMKPLIREPERVIPLMDKYYQEQTPFTPPTYRRLPLEEDTRVDKRFIGVKMEDAAFQNFVVTLEKTPQGYLVDWESFVKYGDMTVAQLRTTRPTTPVTMRCVLSLNTYYNYGFRDETMYQSYKLKIKDEESLYGYVRKLSPTHVKIQRSQLTEETLYCVIKLKFPENANTDQQVEITEFLQSGWVFRDIPELVPIHPAPTAAP